VRNRAALNLATLGPGDIERRLYAATSAGFSAVGLSCEELRQQGDEALQELRLSMVPVAELSALTGWMDSSRTARTLALVAAEGAFELAAQLGCSVVVAWPSQEPFEALGAATRFADLCRAAEKQGARVGLEFLGQSQYVADLATAWEIVESADAPNGGLVIDTFHFHVGGSTLDMLEPIPGEKILLVQVSDGPNLPRRELRESHRLYPGTGEFALEPLLAALRAKGYEGYYSLELHNEEYWQENPMIVAREGFRAMERLDLV
jgi:4-hydroxyphenylpyruvate dioxygenase